MNSTATTQPDLSVILVTPDCYETIRKSVRSLSAQTVCQRLEIVIVAQSEQTLSPVAKDLEAFHSVQIIEFDPIQTLAAPRAAAIRAARAPLVAVGEDHAFPDPTWAETLIEAHRQSWAAVGPVFINANPGFLSWIGLHMDYGRWLEPVDSGVTDDVAGHNSAWRRDLLLEYGSVLERMMQAPTILHWDLQAKGHQLYLEPTAKVRHANISRFSSFIFDHFCGARVFGAARAQNWSWLQRLSYVAGTPILMAQKLGECLGHMRRTGLDRKLLPAAWPLLLLVVVVWSLGEMTGYGLGMGKAEHRTLKYDARRGPYFSRRDRELHGIC